MIFGSYAGMQAEGGLRNLGDDSVTVRHGFVGEPQRKDTSLVLSVSLEPGRVRVRRAKIGGVTYFVIMIVILDGLTLEAPVGWNLST